MDRLEKYRGVIPAFYACYDDAGEISPQRTRALARHLIGKGVKGLYVCGSSGECIYQSVEERKITLENVMAEAKGKATVIAHVACNNTRDSVELACHAEAQGVDAIAVSRRSISTCRNTRLRNIGIRFLPPPPHTDFVIYNIPQLAGVALTMPLFREMRKNSRVVAVKNSSMPVQDIQMFKAEGGKDFIVFNGPDEQFVGGRAMGADGGIGGTYAVMPELFLKADALVRAGELETAREIQYAIDEIIYTMCGSRANLYAVMKEILKRKGVDVGSVRAPLTPVSEVDLPVVEHSMAMIDAAIEKYTVI